MEPRSILLKLGLNDKEAAVYIAAHKLGIAPVSTIAARAQLKRPTTHETLKKLCSKGIAKKFLKHKMQYYSMISPRTLYDRFVEHLEELEAIVPTMMQSHGSVHAQPRVTCFEGKKELQDLFVNVMGQCREILYVALPKKRRTYFGVQWLKTIYTQRQRQKHSAMRCLLPVTEASCMLQSAIQDTRLVSNDNLPLLNEVYITENQMAIFSYEEDFAVRIEHTNMVHSQRAMFEFMWGSGVELEVV